jgi:hypothetical protein
MVVAIQTTQLVTVSAGQVNQQIPIPAPLPFVLKELRISSSTASFEVSLWCRALQGSVLRLQGIAPSIEGSSSNLVAVFAQEHDILPGDVLQVSGTSHAPYNGNHSVIAVLSPTAVKLATVDSAASVGGQGQYMVPAHHQAIYSVMAPANTSSGLLIVGMDLPVVSMDQKRSTPEKRLYVVFNAAGNYVVSLRGLIAHY